MRFDPDLTPTPELLAAVRTINEFAEKHGGGDRWQIGGLGPLFGRDAEIAQLRAILALHDAKEAARRVQAAKNHVTHGRVPV